jgi:tRNA A37 threonylcarbamoyladenosine modification protein TsaB
MSRLAFCVFAKQLHVAWSGGDVILPIGDNRLETILFDVLSTLKMNSVNNITIPAGPAPFTQLRILRATQLGLATGFKCDASLVNMFDVLFTGAKVPTGSCFLETRRGDYFFQTRVDGKVTGEGIKAFDKNKDSLDCHPRESEDDNPIISDDPLLSTIQVNQNLAKTMLENDFEVSTELIYGIVLPYSIQPKA